MAVTTRRISKPRVLQNESTRGPRQATERVSDRELGLAAVLVGLVVLLTTVVVPGLG